MLPFSWKGSVEIELPHKSDGEILILILQVLRAEKAQNIRYTNNRVRFSGGQFRWVRKSNRLNSITTGTITFKRQNEQVVKVQYYLTFWILLLTSTAVIAVIFGPVIWDYSSSNPQTKALILGGIWSWLCGGNLALVLIGFPHFLKKSLISRTLKTKSKHD